MRHSTLTALALVALGSALACSDVVAPPSASPGPGAPSFSGGPPPKVTICHAAGRAGTTHFITLTLSQNGLNGHFNNNGTPKAGHEQDYLGPCTGPSGTLLVCVANGTKAATGLGSDVFHFALDVSTFDVNIPDVGQPTNCADPITISTGPLEIDGQQPTGVWLMCLWGGTLISGHIGDVTFRGEANAVSTTIVVNTTTKVTYLEGFDNVADNGFKCPPNPPSP